MSSQDLNIDTNLNVKFSSCHSKIVLIYCRYKEKLLRINNNAKNIISTNLVSSFEKIIKSIPEPKVNKLKYIGYT